MSKKTRIQTSLDPCFLYLIEFFFACAELVVSAAESEQILVTAALDDHSVLEYHDRIRVAYCRESVRYYKGGAVLHQSVHSVFYMALSTCIDGASSFIKDEDGGFRECGTCDVKKLSLTLREV